MHMIKRPGNLIIITVKRYGFKKNFKTNWHGKIKQSTYITKFKQVRSRSLYSKGRRLLDLMDLAVFDFLMGNADRHSYDYIE